MCSNGRVCASSVPAHIISSARSVCVLVFVYVREDSPLRQLHNHTQGGDKGAGRALGTVDEWSSHIRSETVFDMVKT